MIKYAIFPTDESYYDHSKAFKELEEIDWKTDLTLEIGDIVYIYNTDIKAIKYKMQVTENNTLKILRTKIDDSKYFKDPVFYKYTFQSKFLRLKFIEVFPSTLLSYEYLTNQQIINEPIRSIRMLESNQLIEDRITFYHQNEYDNKFNQMILYGAIGTGKSLAIQNYLFTHFKYEYNSPNIFRVGFYEAYNYENFVISRDGEPGPFALALLRAYETLNEVENKEKDVVLVVEDFNQGNYRNIFGDLTTALERDVNGYSLFPIVNQRLYNYLISNTKYELNLLNNRIILPPNLSIIGIYHSNESIYPIDSSFMRHFTMRYHKIAYQDSIFNNRFIRLSQNEKVLLINFIKILNHYLIIELDINAYQQIGPRFFANNEFEGSYLKDEVVKSKLLKIIYENIAHSELDKSKIFNEQIKTFDDVTNFENLKDIFNISLVRLFIKETI